RITPRRDMLARYGIRLGDFSKAVSTALGGSVVAEVYDEGFAYDVTVILDPAFRSSAEDIGRVTVDSEQGQVPLAVLAEISSATGPNTINRENVERRLLISANVDGRDLRGAVNEIRDKVAGQVDLPEGYHIVYGGQFESEQAASRTLMWTSLGAILIIFMLLYGEFHNVAQSAVILVNMPLALIGGVVMLALTGGELNIPAIIGFISLMGISTRNGMLLISRYNQLEAAGLSVESRIGEGSADRLLPIVMTALTSALALIPLALNGDAPGNEIQAPMAIVILGGLVSSTALNIYVVPALYQIISSRKR
ncbi:MAG: efflux RND transporter permease subunit, partial [Muribaculaceae bacterium]|nr:efflux RND transporter permease subunit [Muribaculaceae bacterium]